MYADGSINVSGDGSLTATAGEAGERSYGVYAEGSITVSGAGSLIGEGGTSTGEFGTSYGVNAYSITVEGGSLIGEGGTATGEYGTSCGVNTFSINVSGGSLNGTGGEDSNYSTGVYASNSITVSGAGSLTGTGGTGKYGSYGVDGVTFTISGGEVVAKGNDMAFLYVPTIAEGFNPSVWYGESESEANTAGAKDISELENNYSLKYVRIADESAASDTIVEYDIDKKSATVTVKEAGTYTLIFAKYGEGNRLDEVDVVEFKFEKGENTVPQENKDFALGTGDKIMLWKDMTTLVPLCEAYIVK